MDFTTFLKEKSLKRYKVAIHQENGIYEISSSLYSSDASAFLKDLSKDLLKPPPLKSFRLNLNQQLLGFTNYCVQGFVKDSPSISEFNSVFHSFYKHIPINSLFEAISVSRELSRSPSAAKRLPYVLHLLKQNFNHQKFSRQDLLNSLRIHIYKDPNNYLDIKEHIFLFLETHVPPLIQRAKSSDRATPEEIREAIEDFESSLHDCLSRFIDINDMKQFDCFMPSLVLSSDSSPKMCMPITNIYCFDLSHSYLGNKFPWIKNVSLAKNIIDDALIFLNGNFNSDIKATLHEQRGDRSRLIVEFGENLNEKNIPVILETVIGELIDLGNKLKDTDDYWRGSPDYKRNKQMIRTLKAQIDMMRLKNILPEKGDDASTPKIKKL